MSSTEPCSPVLQVTGHDVIIHPADEGGYWAEVPDIPGCASQGATLDELRSNIQEAIEACLLADPETLTGECRQ